VLRRQYPVDQPCLLDNGTSANDSNCVVICHNKPDIIKSCDTYCRCTTVHPSASSLRWSTFKSSVRCFPLPPLVSSLVPNRPRGWLRRKFFGEGRSRVPLSGWRDRPSREGRDDFESILSYSPSLGQCNKA
jgi:hypothetical protein